MKKTLEIINLTFEVFAISFLSVFFLLLIGATYLIGYTRGVDDGRGNAEVEYSSAILKMFSDIKPSPSSVPAPSPHLVKQNDSLIKNVSWGGPELWQEINNKRIEFGVNPLDQRDNLCTIASIRLNDLLELGKLDGHEGFGNLSERRPDLEAILESYSTVAEFLLAGADSTKEAVSLWENTLAHKKLLTAGEYVWGCVYAQNSFAVAITAF